MTVLLDGNVLIALAATDHVHHERARQWFAAMSGDFATCPITEGTLIRFLVREGMRLVAAQQLLSTVVADSRHEFWPDDLSYTRAELQSVIGHRQVTDAYLVALAERHGAQVVTFDRGLAQTFGPNMVLVPTG